MEKTFSDQGITLLEHKQTDKFVRFIVTDTEAGRTKTVRAVRNAGYDVDTLKKDVQTFKKWNSYENVRVFTFSSDKLFIDSPKAASKQAGVSGSVPMHISLQELAKMQATGKMV